MRMDSLKIVRLWAAAAWADGSMHPSEAAALRRLIEASETLSVNDRELALTYLETAPDVDVSEGVYRAARGIVMLDRELADSEAEFLVQLRASLQLSEATIAKVDAE